VAKGEWITLGIGFAAVILFLFIGRFCPNERKKLLKAIDEHFANAPKTRQRVRG